MPKHSSAIGKPSRVYTFPRSSNLVAAGENHAYIVWMAKGKGTKLKLSRVDLKTGKVATRDLRDGHDNTYPSIGLIGDRLMVAFHNRIINKPKDDAIPGLARIVTEVVSVESEIAQTFEEPEAVAEELRYLIEVLP